MQFFQFSLLFLLSLFVQTHFSLESLEELKLIFRALLKEETLPLYIPQLSSALRCRRTFKFPFKCLVYVELLIENDSLYFFKPRNIYFLQNIKLKFTVIVCYR